MAQGKYIQFDNQLKINHKNPFRLAFHEIQDPRKLLLEFVTRSDKTSLIAIKILS